MLLTRQVRQFTCLIHLPGKVFDSPVCSALRNSAGVSLASADQLADRAEASEGLSALEWHVCMCF